MSKKNTPVVESTELELAQTQELTNISICKLNEYTDSILALNNKVIENKFQVASILAEIDDTKLYKFGGFKNITDYASAMFDYKRSETYTLVRVGKDGFEKMLLDMGIKNFNFKQIERMLPLGTKEEIIESISTGVITPDMTSNDIADYVKTTKAPKEPKTKSEFDIKNKALAKAIQDCQDLVIKIPELDLKERFKAIFDDVSKHLEELQDSDLE